MRWRAGARSSAISDRALTGEWRELADALRAHMAAGGDPSTSLERMYEGEEPEAASRGTMDADLMAYLRRALEALPHTG